MKQELEFLRQQLTELEKSFVQQVGQIEQRIQCLERQGEVLSPSETTFETRTFVDEKPVAELPSPPHSSGQVHTLLDIQSQNLSHKQVQASEASTSINSVEKSLDEPTVSVVDALGEYIFETLAPSVSPLSGLINKSKALYHHYHSRGKAPVLLMAIAGIIAIILGFGYLLQYSFSEYLSSVGKVLLGYSVAISVTIGSIWFTRKSPDMAEFGSGLVGLGIILNYLATYFAGEYYQLLPASGTLLILSLITALAYGVSIIFETRVIAIVSLVGGAFAPLIMADGALSPDLYLSYLLVLILAMMQLSKRIQWQQLAHTSILISFGIISYILYSHVDEGVFTLQFVCLLHGFFYSSVWHLLDEIKRKYPASEFTIISLTSNLIFFLVALSQVVEHTRVLGLIYLLNLIPWVILYFFSRLIFKLDSVFDSSEKQHTIQAISLVFSGLLTGVCILVLVESQFAGLIWGVEGLILLYLGLKFKFKSVRIEALILSGGALLQSIYYITLWLINSGQSLQLSFDFGWLALLFSTLLLGMVILLFGYYSKIITQMEQAIYQVLDEIYSVYLSLLFLLTVGLFWNQAMGLLAVLPLFFHITRSQKRQLKFTEGFGLAHYALLAVPIFISMAEVNSAYFFDQLFTGKIAMIEAFIALWLIPEFYQRAYPNASMTQDISSLKHVFYGLLPVFFLPNIWHLAPEFMPIALWASSCIALLLFKQLKLPFLKMEMYFLTGIASFGAVLACFLKSYGLWDSYALSALLCGLLVYANTLLRWQGFKKTHQVSEALYFMHQELKPLFTLAIFYAGASLFVFSYIFSQSFILASTVLMVYFTALFNLKQILIPLRNYLRPVYQLIMALCSYIILMQFYYFGALYTAIAVCCGAIMMYRSGLQFRALWTSPGSFGAYIWHLWFFHGLVIAAYSGLVFQFLEAGVGPALSILLVLHATILLFQTLNPAFKGLLNLSIGLYGFVALKIVFWDMSQFDLIQKMIAFIVIGVLLLSGAYQYQKQTKIKGSIE